MSHRPPDLSVEPGGGAEASVGAARRRRELLAGLGADPRPRRARGVGAAAEAGGSTGVPADRPVDPAEPARGRRAEVRRGAGGVSGAPLQGAVVVPSGAIGRGYLRAPALVLAGEWVGNVHCTAGPAVVRPGARLRGRLVAGGDVLVCGEVGDAGGGAAIVARGRVTLACGAHVIGDVRSGQLHVRAGAVLEGTGRPFVD